MVLYFKDDTIQPSPYFGFLVKYLSIPAVLIFLLQLLFDAWGQCQCRQQWLIRAKPQIDLNHVMYEQCPVFLTTFSYFFSSWDQNLSERVSPFVSQRYAAHNRAHIHNTHPPQIPVKRGSVFRGGLWRFLNEMTEDTKEKNNAKAFQQSPDNRAQNEEASTTSIPFVRNIKG